VQAVRKTLILCGFSEIKFSSGDIQYHLSLCPLWAELWAEI